MAAGTFTLYSKNKDRISAGELAGVTVHMALVTSAYVPNNASNGHSLWSEVSANEIAAGNGYTAGGQALANKLATAIAGGFKFSSDPVSWTASGSGIPAHRYYVMYVLGTLWGRVNPLIGYFLGDATPADVPLTTAGNPLTATPNAAGWFDAT